MIKSKKLSQLLKEDATSTSLVIFALLTAITTEYFFRILNTETNFLFTISRTIIVFLSLAIFQDYALRSLNRFKPSNKDLVLLNTVLFSSIIILWFGNVFSIALCDYLNDFKTFANLDPQTLHYAIPFAFGGLLIAAVKGLVFGLVLSISFSVIVGFYLPNDLLIIPFVLITTLIACRSLEELRNRSSYLKAALEIGVIAIPFSLIALVFTEDISGVDIVFRTFTPLVGGLLSVAIAAAFTPLLEHVGGYVTDLRLIEMSTLDHPLLKELSIQTPGTWNHSMVLGMMVEAAAKEVGANSVLSRVGAYFHDVGKTKKPLYFIENQGGGENKHDRLSPSMSALIIRSHVKDGVEIAKEHRLPEAIIDLIKQHHGTSLIEYFYKKAIAEAEATEESVEVDKSLYTYPGPKPQTREAGILMLADIIESSSRVIPDLTHDRIQKHVQTMINRVFSSGQLDECDLTLRDLHKIAKSFTRVLNGIHHQRIAYEESDRGKNQDKSKSENKQSKKEASKENIKEDKKEKKETSNEKKEKNSSKEGKPTKEKTKGNTEKKLDDNGTEQSSEGKDKSELNKKPVQSDLKRLGIE